uniref:THAP-type domain-containing protein n=1 Tax=Astyanax mexicanus TaxID=7994 RepID=A0A8B9JWR5_ASTMX
MVRTCDYPGCSNKDVADSPHSFHRIPVTDIALRQLWILAMGFHVDTKVVKMKKLRVCGAHFSEDDYVSPCPLLFVMQAAAGPPTSSSIDRFCISGITKSHSWQQ